MAAKVIRKSTPDEQQSESATTKHLYAVLVVVCLLVGAVLRIRSVDTVIHRTPDEVHYAEDGRILAAQGHAGLAEIQAKFLADPDRPSPTRLFYLDLLAATMRITDDTTELAGAYLSCAMSLLALVLVALVSRRWMTHAAALGATALYATLPLALMTSRRTWEEATVEALLMVVTAVGCELVFAQHGRRIETLLLAGYGLLGGVCWATKEMAFVGYALLTVLMMLELSRAWRKRTVLFVAVAACIGVAASALWVGASLGSFPALWRYPQATAAFLSTSAYSLDSETGSFITLAGLLGSCCAVTTFCAIVAIAVLAYWRKRKQQSRYDPRLPVALAAMVLLLFSMICLVPHHLNLRYACGAFAPLCLLAGFGFGVIAQRLSEFRVLPAGAWTGISAVALAVASGFQLVNFHQTLELGDTQDLSAGLLHEAQSGRADSPAATNVTTNLSKAQAAALMADSARLLMQHKPEEALTLAEAAIRADPTNALAWNNVAAANEDLHRWDAAIAAAQHALELQPDFQLARNNLNWAQSQKQAGVK